MPPQTTRPPLRTARSAVGTRSPTGANRIAASSCSGGARVRAARPDRPHLAGEVLRLLVPRPGEGEDLAALMARDLRDDMSRRAEAVEADPLRIARGLEAAPADQPGAEQRRGGDGVGLSSSFSVNAASLSMCVAKPPSRV